VFNKKTEFRDNLNLLILKIYSLIVVKEKAPFVKEKVLSIKTLK